MSLKNTNTEKTAIFVAIIGLIGTSIVAFFGFLASIKPIEITISATQTSEAKLNTVVSSSTTTSPTIIFTTITPTLTPILSTPAIIDETPFWKIAFQESFDTNTNKWADSDITGDLSSDDWIRLSRRFINGVYKVEGQPRYGTPYWLFPTYSNLPPKFLVAVDAKQDGGDKKSGSYGIIFCYINPQNFYRFTIRDDQFFAVELKYDNNWITLSDWSKSNAIRPDEINNLKVIANNSQFFFFINNQYVGEINDNRLENGLAGLTMHLTAISDTYLFEFDNFTISTP
jgi:hypothetical protein